MSQSPPFSNPHRHVYLGQDLHRNERRTRAVIVLTALTMVAEIGAGSLYGSMALTADGWHMATHAAAMLITAAAYLFSRRHADDPRYCFGTGRLGDLGGFTSAVVLALVALEIGWESAQRLIAPVEIHYDQALLVAVLGLLVNVVSAWLLKGDHGHDHGHGHGDNNLRAAYLHVLADALTSVLAIAALVAGRLWGWNWLDPLIGVAGALVIARWSWGLLQESGAVLVGRLPEGLALPQAIRAAIETEADSIVDLHVWQVGPSHFAAIVAIASVRPQPLAQYRDRLGHLSTLSHLTVEIQVPELDKPER